MYYDWQGEPIDLMQWVALFEDNRSLGDTEVSGVRVSTVWLGLDHRLLGLGPPLIFETMIFGGGHHHGDCWRYATEREARAGHADVVAQMTRNAVV